VAELDERLVAAGEMWGGADYESIAVRFAPIHDGLVARLEPHRGDRWLDVATGTGKIALRAARAGAEVTGFDLAPMLLGQARAAAEEEGLDIRWDLGTAEALPYEDGAFDVVSSAFGVIFAPDHRAASRELARVSARGARLGLATWRPQPEIDAIYERFATGPPPFDPEVWTSEEGVRGLLDHDFELEFAEGVWRLEAESPEAAWKFFSTAIPPINALLAQLGADRRPEFREAWIDHWARYRAADGSVSEPREYLLVYGGRR
jgi:SAM-dependent methyltransferase